MKMVTMFYKGDNAVWKRDLVENPHYRSFIDYKPIGTREMSGLLASIITFHISSIIMKLAIEDRHNSKGYSIEPEPLMMRHILSLYGAGKFRDICIKMFKAENDIDKLKYILESSMSRVMSVTIRAMYIENSNLPLFTGNNKDAINKARMLLIDNMTDTFNIDSMMEVVMEFKELYYELKEQEKESEEEKKED